jgi:heme-degrading monooxygenase HmoA
VFSHSMASLPKAPAPNTAVHRARARAARAGDCERLDVRRKDPSVISRHWRGLARVAFAEAYVEHLQQETFPAIRKLPGFVSASILRRSVPEGVEFLVVTNWLSVGAIREFAGANAETAVVPQKVQDMMVEYDRIVRHYVVVS